MSEAQRQIDDRFKRRLMLRHAVRAGTARIVDLDPLRR